MRWSKELVGKEKKRSRVVDEMEYRASGEEGIRRQRTGEEGKSGSVERSWEKGEHDEMGRNLG